MTTPGPLQRHRRANRLTINYRHTDATPAGLYIDGVRFPYMIHPGVDFQLDDLAAPSIQIRLFGNAITVIGVDGTIDEKTVSTLEQDEEWLLATVEILQALGFTVTPPTPVEDDPAQLEPTTEGEPQS